MKVLLYTSVLVAAMVEAHPEHERALPWLQRAKRKELVAVVASHTLAELYSVLTSLPIKPRISPSTAWRLISGNVLSVPEIIVLSSQDYQTVLEKLSEEGIIGGAVYDALIAHAAVKAQVDRLVTLNVKDFRRVYPAFAERIIRP